MNRRDADVMTVEILEDGSIKITTGSVSGGNHRSADELLEVMGELMGGKVTEEREARGREEQRVGRERHDRR